MANTGVSAKPEAVRNIIWSSLTATFALLGGPVLRPLNEVTLINETNSAVEVSLDGVNVHWRISPFTARTLDPATDDLFIDTGQQFYVRYAQYPSGTPAPTGPTYAVFAIETMTR